MKRPGVGLLLLLAAVLLAAGCRLGRPPRPTGAPQSGPWFEDRAAAAGITWRLGHGGKSPLTILEVMGTGCAVLDFDSDGRDDLFLVGQEGTGSTGRCALYHNRGDGTFEDVTRGSGLDLPGYYMGCATGDLDNDGRPDLFVSGYGLNRLYHNRGGGRFEDVTTRAGLRALGPADWNAAAAFGDYDHDGRVDLYVGRYVVFHAKKRQFCNYAGGVSGSCPPWIYDPQKGALYRNQGDGVFADVTRAAGLSDQHGKTLGAIFADPNSDGRTDLYLANDGVPGDFYENRGGRFANKGTASGTAYNAEGSTQAGMGVDFGDVDGDGRQDLVVTTFEKESLSLYANLGGPAFEHRAQSLGLDAPTRRFTAFGVRLADFDNDGWPDLAVANGHVVDREAQVDRYSSYPQTLQFFRNEEGVRYTDRSADAGPGFTTPAVGRGLATGDFDGDGRLDLLVVDLEGAPRLLMNRTPPTNGWIGFRLRGTRSNRMGLGAVVTVECGGRRWIGECRTSGSYFSASSPAVHFGLGTSTGTARATIRWPSGTRMMLSDLPLNRYHPVEETRSSSDSAKPADASGPAPGQESGR